MCMSVIVVKRNLCLLKNQSGEIHAVVSPLKDYRQAD